MLASFPGPTQSLVHGESLGTRCVKCINYLQVHVRLSPHYAFLATCKWWCMYPQYWVFTRHTLIPSHRKPNASCALHSPAWLRASIVRRGGWRSCGKHTSLHWHWKRPSSRNCRICCVSKRSRSDSWRPVWGVTYPPHLSRLAETKDLLQVFCIAVQKLTTVCYCIDINLTTTTFPMLGSFPSPTQLPTTCSTNDWGGHGPFYHVSMIHWPIEFQDLIKRKCFTYFSNNYVLSTLCVCVWWSLSTSLVCVVSCLVPMLLWAPVHPSTTIKLF